MENNNDERYKMTKISEKMAKRGINRAIRNKNQGKSHKIEQKTYKTIVQSVN